MDSVIIFGALVAGVLLWSATLKNIDVCGMDDSPVSLDNVRRGIAQGWYAAVLTKVGGRSAIRLTGLTADGDSFSDVYPISDEDYYTLLNVDGLQEV